MKIEWYVLKRDDEREIVSVLEGNDPLYGNGSWDIDTGPWASIEEAETSPEQIIRETLVRLDNPLTSVARKLVGPEERIERSIDNAYND